MTQGLAGGVAGLAFVRRSIGAGDAASPSLDRQGSRRHRAPNSSGYIRVDSVMTEHGEVVRGSENGLTLAHDLARLVVNTEVKSRERPGQVIGAN